MSPYWLVFAAGVFVGIFLGISIISLLVVGRRAEDNAAHLRSPDPGRET